MKGVEEDKVIGPLFPRLHVNDTHKGGPKAPLRNKMALYEQLSIPSQRFNSSSSTMPFPPCHFNNSVPSLSSSQGCGQQRKMLSPFRMTSQMPVHSAEKAGTSDGVNLVGKGWNCTGNPLSKKKESLVFDDVERQDGDDAYEPSMAGTESSLDISPDDIIAVIGTKHFVKAEELLSISRGCLEYKFLSFTY